MKPKYIVHIVIGLLVAMFVYSQFIDRSGERQVQPITDSLIVETYPKLYDAIYARDVQQLHPFLDHDSTIIQKQAWRALASTPLDSLTPYLDRALKSNLPESWIALSMHDFTPSRIQQLQQLWLERNELRSGISLVLGRQGDRAGLDFLLDQLEEISGSSYEYQYALAIGRLSIQHTIETSAQQRIIEQAFLSEDPDIIRAYLYGFYRGNRQSMNADTRALLYSSWKQYGLGNSDEVDQFMVRLLGGDVFYEITMYQNSENLLDLNIQLAVELAQASGRVEMNERNVLATRILLMHENPHVPIETLKSLKGELNSGDNLLNFIVSEIVEATTSNAYVWLQAIETASSVEPELIEEHSARLDKIAEERPYLLPQVLQVWSQYENQTEYINRIRKILDRDDALGSLHAVNALSTYWSSMPEGERGSGLIEDIRTTVFEALENPDRGIAYASADLLGEESLFNERDFNRINAVLQNFSLPEDIEVYQRFGALYKQRFEQQAEPVIDSLAALGYQPLNRAFLESGWEVSTAGNSQAGSEFRQPDWERIWEMGRNPLWVLQTEKGLIKVEMNTLSAPATISAIDSLTRAEAYNDVPFHRVIPNFVIQGGDIEQQNGYGGPDFVLPTEASEAEFRRGVAGIASAGTDTEGSQYFFMHQWKPHLNGGYTLFGKVVEGMDVVDRILPGEKVLYAYWE